MRPLGAESSVFLQKSKDKILQYREGRNESLWKRFIGVVSDEK